MSDVEILSQTIEAPRRAEHYSAYSPTLDTFIFKVASRCNLNCSYCYVYNRGDDTWKTRPALMSDEVFETALERISQHCEKHSSRRLTVGFHGGEPCLIGARRFFKWCARIREKLKDITEVQLVIQTNGTLFDREWAEGFRSHSVSVGVSVDGNEQQHDLNRVDHKGRGSYNSVVGGINLLHKYNVPFTALCVLPLEADDPLLVHRSLVSLRPARINYLLPDFTHNTIDYVLRKYGTQPCANFLTPIFDEWWSNGSMDMPVTIFLQIARIILGGGSSLDTFGNGPLSFVFIETNGDIEGLDVLKVCSNGMAGTGLNVRSNYLEDVINLSSIQAQAVKGDVPLPSACSRCLEATTCAGGYLPHRYKTSSGFDNPSVWCTDILSLFAHIRSKLSVTVEETYLRRRVLEQMAQQEK